MKYPCSKNVCEKTIFCFSLLLFQRILNAFLYDLYHEIGDILTCPCHYRYIYNNTNTTRVVKRVSGELGPRAKSGRGELGPLAKSGRAKSVRSP